MSIEGVGLRSHVAATKASMEQEKRIGQTRDLERKWNGLLANQFQVDRVPGLNICKAQTEWGRCGLEHENNWVST